jgi:HEPN domain-containing protein
VNRAIDWLKQAESDLEAARDSAATRHHEWAAFQAQQCGEKAVKAVVQHLHGAVRGHSITAILAQIDPEISVPDRVRQAAQELDQVYVTSRYPNGFVSGSPADYFSETTSRRLIESAESIFEFCRSHFP